MVRMKALMARSQVPLALLLFALPAVAIDTEDLNLPANRLVDWLPVTPVDTSNWKVIDVTKPSNCSGCSVLRSPASASVGCPTTA